MMTSRLVVPSLLAALISTALLTAAEAGRKATHVVEPGQTLWSIAFVYGVRVEQLLELNSIEDPSHLLAGQELRLPARSRRTGKPRPNRRRRRTAPTRDPSFMWPLQGRITSRYGRRGRRQHTGLDIAAMQGTIIVASARGRVVRAGSYWGRYGRVVLIEHADGFKSLYSHLSRSFVEVGQTVEQGEAIAAVGATGNATGPHLHFEIWNGDGTEDPLKRLRRKPRRTAQIR